MPSLMTFPYLKVYSISLLVDVICMAIHFTFSSMTHTDFKLNMYVWLYSCTRESVDSLRRDDADMPMPPYIRKACNRPNAAFVSLFMYLTVIYGCFST